MAREDFFLSFFFLQLLLQRVSAPAFLEKETLHRGAAAGTLNLT